MTNQTTLERIKKAWDMGYSATVVFHSTGVSMPYDVISIGRKIWLIGVDGEIVESLRNCHENHTEIRGYKYGAELCGSGEIPEGQKFRSKNHGISGHLDTDDLRSICKNCNGHKEHLYDKDGKFASTGCYDKSELEPVFN